MKCLSFVSSLLLVSPLLVFVGCNRDGSIHASEIYPALYTPTPEEQVAPDLNDRFYSAPFSEEEELLSADTFIDLWVFNQEDSYIEARVRHREGYLIAGGVEIPEDSWLDLEGAYDQLNRRIYLKVEDLGHSLEFDGEVASNGSSLKGYFIVDSEYEVWARML